MLTIIIEVTIFIILACVVYAVTRILRRPKHDKPVIPESKPSGQWSGGGGWGK